MKDRLNYMPDDGYTEPGFIAAVEHIHGDFRFTFRPMPVEQQSRHAVASETYKGDAFDRKAADMMLAQLVTWDLTDAKDEPVPILGGTILKLKSPLFNRLYGILSGSSACDTDPQWSAEEADAQAADLLESTIADKTPSQARRERDAKNSDAG